MPELSVDEEDVCQLFYTDGWTLEEIALYYDLPTSVIEALFKKAHDD